MFISGRRCLEQKASALSNLRRIEGSDVTMVITGITDQLPGLVNCYITMERSTIFNGKIHYKWGIFNSYVSHYQRVGSLWSLAPQEPSFLLAQCHLRIADLLCLQVQHSSTHCLEDPILCHAMPCPEVQGHKSSAVEEPLPQESLDDGISLRIIETKN